MSMSKTWCPLPWIHLATRPNGDIRLCCTANASGAGIIDSKSIGLVKSASGVFNLKSNTIEEIWNSDFMKDVRVQMMHNEIPPSCTKCFEEEANGLTSKRNWETNVWNDRIDLSEIVNSTAVDGSLPVNIHYFDLRLGNVCQLKCIMCSPHDSSSWIKDWKQQQPLYTNPELKNDQHWDNTMDYNWYQNNKLISEIKSQSEHIRELYFAGGEPLLIPEHYQILEFMVETGHSKNCVLRYNSNGLSLSDRLFELWESFKEVKFNFSIDAVGGKNDYIRYPSTWHTVEQNLRRLDNTSDNVVVNIACAVQLLNILYLPELIEWKTRAKFKKINVMPYGAGLVGLHLVYLPSYLNVKVLPLNIKKLVTEKISTFIESQTSIDFINDTYGKQRWEGLLKYMNSEDWSHKLFSTREYLAITDATRCTNFREVFPELSNL